MFETRSRRAKIGLQILITVLVLPFLFPLVAMVQGSLAGIGWGNYEAVLSRPELPLFFRNSILISAGTIAVVYVCTMLAAFAFSKLHLRGREVFFWLILAALTLPEVVLLTPLVSTTLQLGLYNTYWSVILPLAALQIPFTVLITRSFMNGIPDGLLEAARIDGASTMRAFWHIILPLTRPIAAAIVVLTFIGAWNNFLLPLVFLQSPDTQTITLLPTFFIGQFNNDQTKVLAAAVITALPIVLAYLLLQRLFERGLAAGAIK
jgi:raffinose/stachyose/melibiose transport system permease protein